MLLISVCDLLDNVNNLVAIFGPTSSECVPLVESICNELGILHIQWHWNPENVEYSSAINMFPESSLLAKGIADIVKEMRWSGYTILYEDNQGLARIQGILKERKIGEPPVLVRQFNSDGDYR